MIPVQVGILVEIAKGAAEGNVADDVEREERDLLEELHGPVLGRRGQVLALDEVHEGQDLPVDAGAEPEAFILFAAKLTIMSVFFQLDGRR